jgi:hypothetical protein
MILATLKFHTELKALKSNEQGRDLKLKAGYL